MFKNIRGERESLLKGGRKTRKEVIGYIQYDKKGLSKK